MAAGGRRLVGNGCADVAAGGRLTFPGTRRADRPGDSPSFRERRRQVRVDQVCGGEHPAGDRPNGHGRVIARLGPGPAGNVREPDRRPVDAQMDRDEDSDGVGFDLAYPLATSGAAAEVGDLAMQQHVPELMGERCDCLFGGGVAADADAPVPPAGEPVAVGAVPALGREALVVGKMHQRGPGADRHLPTAPPHDP